MSNLVVMTFADEEGSTRLLKGLADLQKQNLIKIDDAATVVRRTNGKIKVKQATNLVGQGALGGAFWGMLIGTLFLSPVAGAAVGGLLGGGLGKMADFGINDQFIKEVSDELTPGSSAAFVMVHEAQLEKVIAHLQPFEGEIIHTSLSPAEEQELKQAFATA